MSDNIPFEIQIDIIKRLPIKSLVQIRSVSKPWKSLIDSSEFIADYNSSSHIQPQQLLVSFYNRRYVYILGDDDDDNDNDSFPRYKFPVTLPQSVKLSENKPDNMIGYSQGLFGFYNFNRNANDAVAVIWNPSIRKSVDISVPNVLTWPYGTVVGFGVCNATDPMIIKINFFDRQRFNTISNIPWQVEVFTLSTGRWRSLSNSHSRLPRISIALTRKAVVIGGFIYWLAIERTPVIDLNFLILSFDIACEVFSEISLPPSVADSFSLELSKLRESLVVLDNNIDVRTREHDVWMMTLEDGVQHSFNKLYTIKSPNASIQRVLGFRKNGQPIIEMGYPNQHTLYVYEPDTEHFNDIGIFGIGYSCLAGSYMGTLLLLDHHEGLLE